MGPLLVILLIVIALFLVGGFVFGLLLELLWLAVVGIVIGALGRWVVPGEQDISIPMTVLIGIGGALVGGIIGDIVDAGWFVTFLISVAVAAGAILLVGGSRRRPRTV